MKLIASIMLNNNNSLSNIHISDSQLSIQFLQQFWLHLNHVESYSIDNLKISAELNQTLTIPRLV